MKNILKIVNLSYLLVALFIVTALMTSFVQTSPSDPLQYVSGAIGSPASYQFLDRLLLYIVITLFSKLSFSPENIGPITTLCITSSILLAAIYWLNRRYGNNAAIIFGIIFISSPMVLGISSYTYPTQLMSLFVLLIIFFGQSNLGSIKFLYIGIFYIFVLFSKIQGITIFLYIIYLLFLNKNYRNVSIFACGLILGIILLYYIGLFSNDQFNPYSIIKAYFSKSGDFDVQFKGRNEGKLPPFYLILLSPVFMVSSVGLLIPLVNSKFRHLRFLSYAGIIQLFGLILIYQITQRGGPLIPNYLLDTYLIGIISFSIIIAIEFNHNSRTIYIPFIFLIVICLLSITISFEKYFKVNEWEIKFSLLSIFLWIALSCIFIFKKFRIALSLFIIITLECNFVFALSDGLARKLWSEPYHLTSKALLSLPSENKYNVITRFNTFDYEDGSWRTKATYSTFYEKTIMSSELIKNITFNVKDNNLENILISDSSFYVYEKLGGAYYKTLNIKIADDNKSRQDTILPFDIKDEGADLLLMLHQDGICLPGSYIKVEYKYYFNKITRVLNCDYSTRILDISHLIPANSKNLVISYSNPITNEKNNLNINFNYMISKLKDSSTFPLLLIDKKNLHYLKTNSKFESM